MVLCVKVACVVSGFRASVLAIDRLRLKRTLYLASVITRSDCFVELYVSLNFSMPGGLVQSCEHHWRRWNQELHCRSYQEGRVFL